jgi:hypothetical protein
MRDYWLTKDLLQVVGIGFVLLALIGIGLALWLPKKWWGKLLAVLAVGFVISIPLYKASQESQQQQVVVDNYKERFAKAQALFEERCKTAGDKIYRTAENVDSVLLLRIRPQYENRFSSDPVYPGAALIQESGGDSYIASFLRYEKTDAQNPTWRGELSDRPTLLPGYRTVEAVDPVDGKRYVYTKVYGPNNLPPGEYVSPPKFNKAFALGVPPRYAVTYEDLVDPDDRKHWVAGTVLKVLDTQTNEVIAEQTRYLFDTGLGSTSGGRSPWSWAASYVPSCPKSTGSLGSATRYFVSQVLKPIRGE